MAVEQTIIASVADICQHAFMDNHRIYFTILIMTTYFGQMQSTFNVNFTSLTMLYILLKYLSSI